MRKLAEIKKFFYTATRLEEDVIFMSGIPFVSVVVPMYNSEKYIGELLDSVLNQTLQNFELIVVDDCSTDKSCEIVESYEPKFDGKLILMKSSAANEGAGAKRNRGLEMSIGKYVFFMDADDVLTKTALEEMYNLAEEYQAEVVYCDRYYMSSGTGEGFQKNIHLADDRVQSGDAVKIPTWVAYDLKERIQDWMNYRFAMPPWLKLARRNFLIENDIKFHPLKHQNDFGQTLELLFTAKKFLRIPNPCYIRRMHDNSLSSAPKSLEQILRRWLEKTIRGTKMLNDFIEKLDFFKENPEYKHLVLNWAIVYDFRSLWYVHNDVYRQTSPHVVYEKIHEIFDEQLGEHSVLISCLLSNTFTLTKMYRECQEKLKSLH